MENESQTLECSGSGQQDTVRARWLNHDQSMSRQMKEIVIFWNYLRLYQGGRVVKALDLSSNVRMHTWVRTPFLVWEPGPFFFSFYALIYCMDFFFISSLDNFTYLRFKFKEMSSISIDQHVNCFCVCNSTFENKLTY